jgi:hypothetical protein
MSLRNYNQDVNLIFHDGAAPTTADGGGVVGGSTKVIKLGAGRFDGVMLFDVSAIDISSTDERYVLVVQGCNDAAFTGPKENLAALELGASAVRSGGAINSTTGRYEVPFNTEQDDVTYTFARVFVDVNGTTPSITYKAWAATRQ